MNLARRINDYLGSRHLLVIEPSHAYRTTLKNFFRNLRVKNIKIVNSVSEARQHMLALKVGMFIVEWQLAEKNGLQFCRELRREKNYSSTPFLLLSTENLKQDIMLATEGGIDGYLLKPFSFEDFCEKITALLNHIQSPTNLNSVLHRAEQQLNSGESWVAEALFMEAQNININSARAKCGLAKIDISNQDYAAAKEKLREAIAINHDFIDPYKLLLQIAEITNDTEAVLEHAKYLHEISPDNPRYPLTIAQAFLESGDLSASEKFFKTAVNLSPKMADAHRGLGTLYMRKNDYTRAKKCLERALDLENDDISTLNSLGLAYVRLNLLDEGIKKYRVALSISPQDPRILFNLALALELRGDFGAAADNLRKAIQAEPRFEKAKKNLNRILNLSPTMAHIASHPFVDDDDATSTPQKKGA